MTFKSFYTRLAIIAICSSYVLADAPPILQSEVKGLLVIQLEDGSHAGMASQMNATAIPAEDNTSFHLQFNQEVGELMTSATAEVEKLMRVRHSKNLPVGHTIEFGFSDKHSPKDGPSAAVACALMTESIISGIKLDQTFAVTGDITATGAIRPIGGVNAKIRGASRQNCEIFGVPKANQAAISDLLIMEGIEAVTNIQIILLENFDEALAISRSDKSEDFTKAIEEFNMVSKAIKNNPNNASHPKVLEKLKWILKIMPHHESARLTALYGLKKGNNQLSLSGSFTEIERQANSLSAIIKNSSTYTTKLDNSLWDNMIELKKLRSKVDPRATPLIMAYLDIADFFREHREKKQFTNQLDKELDVLIDKLNSVSDELKNNKEVQEELMN